MNNTTCITDVWIFSLRKINVGLEVLNTSTTHISEALEFFQIFILTFSYPLELRWNLQIMLHINAAWKMKFANTEMLELNESTSINHVHLVL